MPDARGRQFRPQNAIGINARDRNRIGPPEKMTQR